MLFINYAKLKRKLETSVASTVSQSVISTDVEYKYDNAGNPISVKVNSGTQEIQNVFIARDNYQRTKRIQYTGYLQGYMSRELEQNDYNIIRESVDVIENPNVVSELLYESFIKQGICTPAYFRDSDSLTLIANTYNDKHIDNIAIINPNNGPDTYVDDTLYDFVELMKSTNRDVYGYIYTDYGQRSINEVEDDIKMWLQLYPQISGFFVDEVTSDPISILYYNQLIAFIQKQAPNLKVILNPGVIPDFAYFDIADYVVVAEDIPDSLDLDQINNLTKDQLDKSIVIVHDCDLDTMRSLIEEINTRYIYFTDKSDYNELTSYYTQEVIELINKFKQI